MASASATSESNLIPKILWEDERLLVLDKPAGLVVHSDGRTKEGTVIDWLKEHCPELKDVGGLHTLDSGRYVERYGLLHRIDRETSGVLLVAKSLEDFHLYQRQFLDRSVEKTYLAFTLGKPPKEEGVIDEPIGRSRSDFRRWTTGADARGTLRKALTTYKVRVSKGEYSELELSPKTGRTHQLRVHLKALGCPILADARYDTPPALGFERLALHAWKVAVTHQNGMTQVFEAPLPEDFVRAHSLLADV